MECHGDIDGKACISCKRIEDADARILEAEKHLASLKAERVALKNARNASHDRFVKKFPLEIVSRIFIIFVDMHFDNKTLPFIPNHMEGAPLRLGAICHTWRAIAWATPRLWTRISINFCLRERKAIPELATQWLQRTGQLPLSICLYQEQKENMDWDMDRDGDKPLETTAEHSISLIRSACAFSSRWETLHVSLRDDIAGLEDISEYWNPENDGRESILKHLELFELSPEFTKNLFKHLGMKPSPSYVSLFDIDIDCLDIDWSSVITLNTGRLTVKSLKILQAGLCLQELSLNYYTGNSSPPTPIAIPILRSLELRTVEASNILDYLTLPKLEVLRWTPDKTMKGLRSLVARSQCHLKSLQFATFPITGDLIPLLQVTPSLENLSFDRYQSCDPQGLLKSLTMMTSDGAEYLPHLTMLRLGIPLEKKHSWEVIPDIFDPSRSYSSQSSASANLQVLQRKALQLELNVIGRLDASVCIDTTSLHRISQLIEQGIKISMPHRLSQYHNQSSQDFISSSLAFRRSEGETTN